MGSAGLLVNTGIICFSSQMMRNFTLEGRMLAFLVIEHSLFLVRGALEHAIGPVPKWINDEIQRHDFVEDKHMQGKSVDDSDEDEADEQQDEEEAAEEAQRLLQDLDEIHIDDDK